MPHKPQKPLLSSSSDNIHIHITTTKRQFKIFHTVNCKSKYVIYLLECQICKIQYVGKTETPFNVRLNNHRSNALHQKEDTIPTCKHFNNEGHRTAKKYRRQLKPAGKHHTVMSRESFWINKLQTLKPKGLNQELSLIAP